MEPSKTSQARWEQHHNTFTPSLHLVPFCQLCTPQTLNMHISLFTPTKLVRWFMHHCGASLSEQCWFNGLSWHANHALSVTARFVTVCCTMSVVSKTSCRQAVQLSMIIATCWQIPAISPVKEATKSTHTLGLSFKLKLWAESLVPMSVDYAWPFRPEVTSTTVRNLYHMWAACPCL